MSAAAVFGAWSAVGGVIAILAGLVGLRWNHRLRRDGVAAWASVRTEASATAGESPRLVLSYRLTDGRLVERLAGPVRRRGPAQPGRPLLIHYDPADPDHVLAHGRRRLVGDYVFVAAGLCFLALGAVLVAVG